MEAIFGGNDIADFVRLQRKDRIFKVLDHLAARNPTQVSAFLGRTGVLGVLLGKLREVSAALDLLQQRLSLRLDFRNVVFGFVSGTQQNVAGMHTLWRPVFVLVGVVVILDLGVRHLNGVRHFGLIRQDDLQIARLGHIEETLVLGEVSVEVFRLGFEVGGYLGRREADIVDFHFLIAPAIFGLSL